MAHIHRRRLAFRVAPPPKPPTLNGKRWADFVAFALGAGLAFWIGWEAMHAFVEVAANMPLMEARR